MMQRDSDHVVVELVQHKQAGTSAAREAVLSRALARKEALARGSAAPAPHTTSESVTDTSPLRRGPAGPRSPSMSQRGQSAVGGQQEGFPRGRDSHSASPIRQANGKPPPKRVRPLQQKTSVPVSTSEYNFAYLKRSASGSRLNETENATESDFVVASPTKREPKAWKAPNRVGKAGSPERIDLLLKEARQEDAAPFTAQPEPALLSDHGCLLATDHDNRDMADPSAVRSSREAHSPADDNTFSPAPPLDLDEHPATVMRKRSAAGGAFKMPMLQRTGSWTEKPPAPKDDSTSVVSMLNAASFALEGENPQFKVFRVGGLDQSVSISFSTVADKVRALSCSLARPHALCISVYMSHVCLWIPGARGAGQALRRDQGCRHLRKGQEHCVL